MIPSQILKKKREGNELSKDEIHFLVNGLKTGEISDIHITAFLTSCCINGMTPSEIAALTYGMRDSGSKFNFRSIGKPIIDKHSTGGIGDKLSLLLVPIAASLGLAIPMISGRGLGHTGGTVDKLESIVGFNIRLEDSKFYELMNKNSCFMACQTDDLAPADKKLYHIRDITGNVESTGLITASILSKKFVEDLDGLVLDMKVGNGAFMKTKEQAIELAESMANVAREVGLNMRIVFTAMDQPIGLKMGNWLEIEETIDALNGKCPEDLRILTEKLAVAMLLVGKVYNDETTALEAVRKVWDKKIALAKFYEMAEAQGGNIQESYARYSNYKRIDILAENAGFIESYNSYNFGLAGIMIGAGRKHIDDVLDFGAGIEIYQKVGVKVESGDKIATIITSRDNEYLDVIELIKSSIVISDIKPENLGSLILDEWIIN